MIGWLDCSTGVSGDMLLGALVDIGVPLAVLQEAVAALGVESIGLRSETVQRHGLAATRIVVHTSDCAQSRTWRDVRDLLASAQLAHSVKERALAVFARLARAEAAVHGISAEDVHFHEVGALDAIADIVGVCAGIDGLDLTALTVSSVQLGSGSTVSAHGAIPIPAPATLAILAEVPAVVVGGDVPFEMCTPTGAALVAELADSWGPLPAMSVSRLGSGAGSRDLTHVPNLVRMVVGEAIDAVHQDAEPAGSVVLEANVDDMDPRLWPTILAALLKAGASDAWLSPILMKKGRPAHTLHVLVAAQKQTVVLETLFSHTTTIGVRVARIEKVILPRDETATVVVDGTHIRVKRAFHNGRLVNTSVEYEDIVGAADAVDVPVKVLLARAIAAAHNAELLP